MTDKKKTPQEKAFEKKLDIKAKRDHDRHHNNEKLK